MGSSVIGALRVNLGMDTAQFEAGARKAKAEAGGLAGALGGFTKSFGAVASGAAVGTAAVAAFAYGMKQAAEAAQYADDISAQANKLGVSAEYLQAFNHAAEASDVPAETAREALSGLTSAIGALQTKVGDGKIRKAMEALGIPQSQIDSMRTAQDALPILADKIAQLGTVTEQTAFAKKFGIEALLPLLKQGSAGIQGLMDDAKNLGLVLSEDVVQHLADMNERLRVADERARAAGRGLGASLTPMLVAAKEKMVDLVKWLDRAIAGFNKLSDRSSDTLNSQIEQSKGWVDFYESKGNTRAADKERARLSELQEALRNNNRAAMRKRTASRGDGPAEAAAVGDYSSGGSGSGGGSSRSSGSREETQAELFAQAQGANARARERQAEEKAQAAFNKTIIDPKTLQETVTESAAIGLGKAFDQSREDIRADFQYAFEGGLWAAVRGGGKGVLQYLGDLFTRSMVEGASKAASSIFSRATAGGGGGGGLFSTILSAAASAFGIGANANGTSNWRGGLTWVGERGKELVNLPGGTQITPNHALGEGGGVRTIRIVTEASPYFDTRVEEVAGPMAMRAAVAGAQSGSQMAEERLARRGRQRFA